MNPSIVQQAQQQAQNNFNNNFATTGIGSFASGNSTIDQARQALAGGATTNATPAATGGSKANIFERALPTIGGIVGGLISAPAEALDLVSGVGGTALNIAGASGGAALGKALENKLTGEAGGNGVLGAAAGGALGQAGGEAVGGLIGKGGELLSNAAGDMAEGAAQKGAQATAQKVYASIPKGLRQAHDLDNSLDLANSLGVDATNPQNLIDTGHIANETLDNAVNDALGKAGPVDASSYSDMIRNAISGRNALGSYDPVPLSKGKFGLPNTPAGKLLQQLEGYGTGIATSKADPTAVRSLLQDVGKAYGDSEPSVTAMTGAKDPVQIQTHEAIGDVYNNLKGLLYNRPEVAQNFKALEGNIQASDVGGNQLLADRLNNVLAAADTHQPVLDALQQFGNVRNVGQDALTASKGVVGDVANGNSKMGNLAEAGVNLGGLYEGLIGGHPAGLLAPLVYNAAKSPAALGTAGGLISKVGDSALPGALGATVGTSPSDVAGPAGADSSVQLPTMNQGNSILDQALMQAMENPLNGGLSQVSTLLPMVQKAHQAQAAEQALAHDYNLAGGAQGPLGGILSRLGATFTGGEAASYPAQAASEAQAIANATGVPAAEVESALPKITQNQSAAQASLGNINSLIQALLLEQGGGQPSGLVGAVSQ